MPSFAEMVGLLGVRSKSVVNFWIDKVCFGGIARSMIYFTLVMA